MEEVSLRIKSPSAVIPDLQLVLSSASRVGEVKARIEAEFPTHPPCAQQKLVYAGKLLQNDAVLRDFLRFEDDCSVFTIHLVCKVDTVESTTTAGSSLRADDSTTSAAESSPSVAAEGLRNRFNPTPLTEAVQLPALPPVPDHLHAAGLSPEASELEAVRHLMMSSYHSAMTEAEMASLQAIYTQYMHLYGQFMQANQSSLPSPAARPAPLNQEARNPAAPLQEAPPAMVDNDGADEEAVGNNDLLDRAYAIIRVLILLCVMYVHSSFFRLLFVAGGIFLAYYFQGRQREVNNDNNNNNNVGNEGPAVVAGEEGVAPAEPEETEPGQARREEEEEPKPNILKVALTFVMTLISSIVPEQNQVV